MSYRCKVRKGIEYIHIHKLYFRALIFFKCVATKLVLYMNIYHKDRQKVCEKNVCITYSNKIIDKNIYALFQRAYQAEQECLFFSLNFKAKVIYF